MATVLRELRRTVRLPWLGQPPDLAIFHEFVRPPYGGGNQFLIALRGELHRSGYRSTNNMIPKGTRACLFNSFNFDFDLLRREAKPGCRMVHRVDGPIGRYRGEDASVDRRIAEINRELADATIFLSRYSLEAHRELGIDLVAPEVILNTVDPAIFHRGPRPEGLRGRRVRLISTSWSDNPNKGQATYRWLDEHLDPSRFEYTFVGRVRAEFRRIRHRPPVGSDALAAELRRHDIYITASLQDPCSNALLEALACGLPAIFARSGGHPEIVGEAGFGFDAPEEIPTMLERLVAEYDARRAAIAIPTLAEVADRYVEVLGLTSRAS